MPGFASGTAEAPDLSAEIAAHFSLTVSTFREIEQFVFCDF